MKFTRYITLFLIVLVAFVSCETEDELPDGSAPPPNELTSTASDGTTVVLSQDNGGNNFSTLSWTPVDFDGREVKYSIELDKVGNNFMSARDILTTDETSATLTVEQINMALINFGIDPNETAEVELRVRSWVDYLTTPTVSNTFKYTLTPYLLTFPPIYVIGDAQAWSLDNAAQLTSNTPGVYTGQVSFIKNGKFRFFTAPDWASQQYGVSYFTGGSVSSDLGDGQDGDSNFLFTGTTGDYIVTVSLPDKSITLQPCNLRDHHHRHLPFILLRHRCLTLKMRSNLYAMKQGITRRLSCWIRIQSSEYLLLQTGLPRNWPGDRLM
jgi:hypothetical protein